MAQLTIRVPDELASDVKAHAVASRRSVNSWVTAVLEAAVNPELAGSEAERLRARLARAGLLAVPERAGVTAPDAAAVRRARRRAGRGTPLSALVVEDRR